MKVDGGLVVSKFGRSLSLTPQKLLSEHVLCSDIKYWLGSECKSVSRPHVFVVATLPFQAGALIRNLYRYFQSNIFRLLFYSKERQLGEADDR